MISWILILYIYAGVFAKGDSVTITEIPNFKSQIECNDAGKAAAPLVAGSAKELKFVCVKQTQ